MSRTLLRLASMIVALTALSACASRPEVTRNADPYMLDVAPYMSSQGGLLERLREKRSLDGMTSSRSSISLI